MASFEWQGLIRVTTGSLSRADQVDLWRVYEKSEWGEKDKTEGIDRLRGVLETDAMVAALATRRIEICKDGKWVTVKAKTTLEHDGDVIELSFPPDYEQINRCPRSLGDQWIALSVERNGSIHDNLRFFSSMIVPTGTTNREQPSDEQP